MQSRRAAVIPITHSATSTGLALFSPAAALQCQLPSMPGGARPPSNARRCEASPQCQAVRGCRCSLQLEPGTSRTRAGSPEIDMVSYVDTGQAGRENNRDMAGKSLGVV